MEKRKSYIERITAFISNMRDAYHVAGGDQPVPPGPDPEEGGDIDPTNPEVVDFGGGTTVEPVDPEQPNTRVLAVGSNCTVTDNTLNLGGAAEGNTLSM